jgi:argininosuccinate lyase
MTGLTRQVSGEIRIQEYQTIATYMRENQTLKEELALFRKAWNETIMLVNKVVQVIAIIERSLTAVDTEVASAEKDWLAFWGIYKESPGLHPPWI